MNLGEKTGNNILKFKLKYTGSLEYFKKTRKTKSNNTISSRHQLTSDSANKKIMAYVDSKRII